MQQIWKCAQCHHEWQGRGRPCDWCGCPECVFLRYAYTTRPAPTNDTTNPSEDVP